MASIGLAAELLNATEVSISDGTDEFIQLQELNLDLSHPETIEETVDAVHYFYGHQQGFIEGTILASKNEWVNFIGKCQRNTNGGAITNNWQLAYNHLDGVTKTLTLTATMAPNFRAEKAINGAVKFRFRLRVTELVDPSDVT